MHLLAKILLSSHFVLFSGAAFDLSTTRIAIERYHLHEIGVSGNSAKPQVIAIAIHITTVEALSYSARRGGHPTIAKNNLLIHGFFHYGLGFWNVNQIRLQKERLKRVRE